MELEHFVLMELMFHTLRHPSLTFDPTFFWTIAGEPAELQIWLLILVMCGSTIKMPYRDNSKVKNVIFSILRALIVTH